MRRDAPVQLLELRGVAQVALPTPLPSAASHYSRVSMEQVLQCDKAAWVRMAEALPTLKRDATGHLPMDKALEVLSADPSVMFHVMPLPGPSLRQDTKGKGKAPNAQRRVRRRSLVAARGPVRAFHRQCQQSSRTLVSSTIAPSQRRGCVGTLTLPKAVPLQSVVNRANVACINACTVKVLTHWLNAPHSSRTSDSPVTPAPSLILFCLSSLLMLTNHPSQFCLPQLAILWLRETRFCIMIRMTPSPCLCPPRTNLPVPNSTSLRPPFVSMSSAWP